jgi:hypothetical protein
MADPGNQVFWQSEEKQGDFHSKPVRWIPYGKQVVVQVQVWNREVQSEEKKKKDAVAWDRTRVTRVTGGNTYTILQRPFCS